MMEPSSKKLIIYLSPYDILRPRTNQVSDVRFCEGFAQNNCEIHLITPFVFRADNISKEQVQKVYGLENIFPVHYLSTKFTKDIEGLHRMFLVSILGFISALKILRNAKNKDTKKYIISRSVVLLQLFLSTKKYLPFLLKNVYIVHWAHDFKNRKSYLTTYRRCDYILATNSTLLNDLINETGIAKNKTAITLNPITEAQAKQFPDKSKARSIVGIAENIPLIVYTGKLGIDYNKELIYILEAAGQLPSYTFLFTGGKPEVIKHWQSWCHLREINNCVFTGYISDYSTIIHYQQSADVLVSYYTNQGHHTSYNLPNKICEYMLTGNVIVTPNFGATRDLLNDSNCIFAEPEESKLLVDALRYAMEHPEIAKSKATQAINDVKEITFKKRIALVLNLFSTN